MTLNILRPLRPLCRATAILAAGVIAATSLLHAQGAQSPRGAQGAQGTTPTVVDPIALQSEISANADFDVAALWRRLKIPAELDTVYAKVGDDAPLTPGGRVAFDRCANACLAELTRANLDDDRVEEVILNIYQASKVSRFLIFKPSADRSGRIQWQFLGYADHDALGQYDPEYRVSFMGGRRYFVMSASGAHGTGMWLRYDRWYEVGATSVREVLSLPAEGVECLDARSLCRAFASTVVGARTGPRGEEFVVNFSVRYWGDEFLLDTSRSGEVPLFARSQNAVFVRPKGATTYTLAPLDSAIDSLEVQRVFRPEALNCQDFLTYNAENVQQIAAARATGSPLAVAWLSRYIGACAASPQRTQFLELLTK